MNQSFLDGFVKQAEAQIFNLAAERAARGGLRSIAKRKLGRISALKSKIDSSTFLSGLGVGAGLGYHVADKSDKKSKKK